MIEDFEVSITTAYDVDVINNMLTALDDNFCRKTVGELLQVIFDRVTHQELETFYEAFVESNKGAIKAALTNLCDNNPGYLLEAMFKQVSHEQLTSVLLFAKSAIADDLDFREGE